MPVLDIQIVGDKELRKYLSERPDKFRKAMRVIITKSIASVERESKLKTPVDTGRLRASIGGGNWSGIGIKSGRKVDAGAFPSGNGIIIEDFMGSIGPTVSYAPFVHKRIPFMKIGLDKSTPVIKKVAEAEINKALR